MCIRDRYEAVAPEVIPDGADVLNGSIAVWLSVKPDSPDLLALEMVPPVGGVPPQWETRGSVYAMLALLQRLARGETV